VQGEGSARQCRIKNVTVHSEDRLLEDAVERRIAIFLILNGSCEETTLLEASSDASTGVIEMQYAPDKNRETRQREQGFELMGTLSSMISTFFRRETVDEAHSVTVQGV